MNNSSLSISVLIPTYKRPEKLTRCLDHILLQSRLPEEVIVVVRKEDLASIEVLNSFKTKLNLKEVFTEQTGVVAAENAGLRSIKNDLVAFIDDDGYAPKDWLSRVEKFFLDVPEASAVGGPDIIIKEPWSYHDFPVEKVGLLTWYGRVIGNHHRKSSGSPRKVQVLKGVNMIVKRNELPFLDELLAGKEGHLGNGSQWELDVCLSIRNKGGTIFFIPDLIVEHDSDHSGHNMIVAAKNNTHNLSYVMLKNLSFPGNLIFVFYALVIGNQQLPGFLKLLSDLIKKPQREILELHSSKWKGFFQGIKTYLKAKA
jgi:glycosyltransferase involved in cell wall biosynthesis